METESANTKNAHRRRQILAATLRLLRQHGADITTAQIAAEAHCSKETLYNWFGDRQGIMMALVEEQARGMAMVLQSGFEDRESKLEVRLKAGCTLLLDIMTGDAALAVTRMAMAQACSENSTLGTAVLSNWQDQVVSPFIALFNEGNQSGELAVHSANEAFDNLLGLLIGDRQRQLLLGTHKRPDHTAMASIAAKAVQRWLILYRI